MPRKKRERKWRVNNIRRGILPFGPLLDFVNLELTVLNWQDQLFSIMGEEKSCYVTYQTAETTKREKMLESDIGSNLQIELFGTSVVFDEPESMKRISESVVDIEDVLPLISGKPADLASAQKLREELRALLLEISSADLQKPEQQIRLRKKIEKNYGPKPLQRDAFLFPDGDVFFKSWLFESEEFRVLAFFRLGRLFHELCRPVSVRETFLLSQNTGRKIPFKIYNDLLAAKIHGAGEKSGAGQGLKLSVCACGCRSFFLQCGDRDKTFINDRHRVSFHNALRAKAGTGPAPGA